MRILVLKKRVFSLVYIIYENNTWIFDNKIIIIFGVQIVSA